MKMKKKKKSKGQAGNLSGVGPYLSAVCGVFCELVSNDYPVTGKFTGKFFKISQFIGGLLV